MHPITMDFDDEMKGSSFDESDLKLHLSPTEVTSNGTRTRAYQEADCESVEIEARDDCNESTVKRDEEEDDDEIQDEVAKDKEQIEDEDGTDNDDEDGDDEDGDDEDGDDEDGDDEDDEDAVTPTEHRSTRHHVGHHLVASTKADLDNYGLVDPGFSGLSNLSEDEDEEDDAPLTWRGTAEETFSDCTLVVTTKETEVHGDADKETKTKYYVHRAMLGASERRCDYFKKLQKKNPGESTIRIFVQYREAQDAFPALLDFIYFGKLDISTDNAEALRHLADALQCKPLKNAVNKFIKKDFGVGTAVHYIRETFKFKDQVLLEMSLRETAKLFGQIEQDAFVFLQPHLFCAIVKNPYLDCPPESHKLAKDVLHYFQCNPDALNASLLVQLTSVIPEIIQEHAPYFLDLVRRIKPEDDPRGWNDLTHLCIRSANALASDQWVKEDWTGCLTEFFEQGQWAGDVTSRLMITRLVADLTYAQVGFDKQQKWMKKMAKTIEANEKELDELRTHKSKLEVDNVTLQKEKEQMQKDHEKALQVPAQVGTDDMSVASSEVREGPASNLSPRYNEVCRDVAINLGKQVHQKDKQIEELLGQLASKNKELGKMRMMMTQLHARLKFYEATAAAMSPQGAREAVHHHSSSGSGNTTPVRKRSSSPAGKMRSHSPARTMRRSKSPAPRRSISPTPPNNE